MIVHRALPWDPRAAHDEPGGPLWFPQHFQGSGRHDNPGLYDCLYVAEAAVSAIAERLAPFRGTGALQPGLLTHAGRRLALASLELPESALVLDLDEPCTLVRERLRPSAVATRDRSVTQTYAAELHERHPAAALRWWSTLESSWANLTLFDRSAPLLSVHAVRALKVGDPEVQGAAEALGLL